MEKFQTTSVVGKSLYIDAGISPANSGTGELRIYDNNNNIIIVMKEGENSKTLEWKIGHGLNQQDGSLNKGDVIEVSKNEIIVGGIIVSEEELGPFKLQFKGKNKTTNGDFSEIKEGGILVDKVNGKDFSYSNVNSLKLLYAKKNNWNLNMDSEDNNNVVIGSEISTEEKPPVYVVEGEGLHYEGSVNMTSGKEEKINRISDVNIDVMNNGFEIKSIKE